MMHIPPSEARHLSYYDYQALLWNWNDSQTRTEVEPPDGETTMALLDRINSDPRLTGSAPAPELAN